jgi:hypothetical protein
MLSLNGSDGLQQIFIVGKFCYLNYSLMLFIHAGIDV